MGRIGIFRPGGGRGTTYRQLEIRARFTRTAESDDDIVPAVHLAAERATERISGRGRPDA
jgi:hypothetical protein